MAEVNPLSSTQLTFLRRVLAAVERVFSPGYSTCYRCRRPWNRVEHHITDYTETSGCFPLCERCWGALGTPEARLPYYKRLWGRWASERWADDLPEKWERIEAAVRAGL